MKTMVWIGMVQIQTYSLYFIFIFDVPKENSDCAEIRRFIFLGTKIEGFSQ